MQLGQCLELQFYSVIQSEHYAATDVQHKKKDVLEHCKKLRKLCLKRAQLEEHQTLQQLFSDAGGIKTWMLEKLQLA